MSPHRRNIGASRRKRRDDEGEDEGPMEEPEDDSLSEGSVSTHHHDDEDADAEGTEDSDSDDVSSSISPQVDKTNGHQVNGRAHHATRQPNRHSSVSPGKPLMATVSDTEAMMNGMKVSDQASGVAEIHFDDLKEEPDPQPGRTPSAPPTEPRRQTFAERKRRENEKYVRERDTNPAFVPTRGSFFLHDKRSSDTGANGYRPFSKSKSRPYGLIVDGNVRKQPQRQDASEGQWTHDLHDTVAGDDPPSSKPPATSNVLPYPSKPVPTAPKSSPPNRSFSNTVLIGNVPVRVFLPGMDHPIPFSTVPKKQHTRLPQHRPPLRRDKPVRISLPGQPPRYIFPSTERSFIFIPRALRPNQQSFRGRGRGGFYAGRRPSFFNAYTSSVALSRRSSLGKAASQEGYTSPGGSVLSRQTMPTAEIGKPVVRLPPPRPPVGVFPPAGVGPGPGPAVAGIPPPLLPQPQNATYRESHPVPIPMHQPRPQKAVSVADIETPANVSFNPPQPHQEQPFHHQVPTYDASSQPAQTTGPSMTPVSHVPERAIHAQPFQPYGVQPPPTYYPSAYPPGTVYYPVSGPEFPPYNGPVGPASVPGFPGGQQTQYVMPAPPTSAEQPSQTGMIAHEAGGTVYYYDTSQMYPGAPYPAPQPGPGGMVGMGGIMTPPGAPYYYPQPPGGAYYGT